VNRVRSFWTGETALTREQEIHGIESLEALNESMDVECLEVDEMLYDVGEEKEKRRRPHRVLRMPYAHYLVRHVRGEIGQRMHTPATIMQVERHARAEALSHGVRPSDFASIQPHVIAMYFGTRDNDQLSAHVAQQSAAWVKSVDDATKRYRGVYGPQKVSSVG